MFLMRRITESKFIQQNELNKQKITERELTNLNQKIVSWSNKNEEFFFVFKKVLNEIITFFIEQIAIQIRRTWSRDRE